MNTSLFERFGGWMAVLAAIAGLLYAISFVFLQNQLLYALFLTLLGLYAVPASLALYYRVRETDAGFALMALLFGLVGAAGTAIHGGYDLANAINPPTSIPANLADLPSQVDPRGLLVFGFTGIGLFVFSWLMTKTASFSKTLGYLGYLSAILFVVLYLGRLIVLNPANPIILVPVLLNGFIVSPLFYLLLGMALMRAPMPEMAKMAVAQKA